MALRHALTSLAIFLVISALASADTNAASLNSQCRATTSAWTEMRSLVAKTMTEMFMDVWYHLVTEDTGATDASEADGKKNTNATSELSQLNQTSANLTKALASKEKVLQTTKKALETAEKVLEKVTEAHANATEALASKEKVLQTTKKALETAEKVLEKVTEAHANATETNTALSYNLQQQENASIKLKQDLQINASDYGITLGPDVGIVAIFAKIMAFCPQLSSTPDGNPDEPQNNRQDRQNPGKKVTQTDIGSNCVSECTAICSPCPPPCLSEKTKQDIASMSNLTPWMQHFRTAITVFSKFMWYSVSLAVMLICAIGCAIGYAIAYVFMKCFPWIFSIFFPCRNCVLLKENLEAKVRECEELKENLEAKVRECEELKAQLRKTEAFSNGLRTLRQRHFAMD